MLALCWGDVGSDVGVMFGVILGVMLECSWSDDGALVG